MLKRGDIVKYNGIEAIVVVEPFGVDYSSGEKIEGMLLISRSCGWSNYGYTNVWIVYPNHCTFVRHNITTKGNTIIK